MARITRRTWDPFQELRRLQQEVNNLFEAAGLGGPFMAERRESFPRVNIVTNEDESVLFAEVPGVGLEDLDVQIVGTTLTLKGERKPTAEVPAERHYRRERGYGSFGRTVQLPHKVDLERVEAVLKDGILRVTLPKAPEAKPHKIEVKS